MVAPIAPVATTSTARVAGAVLAHVRGVARGVAVGAVGVVVGGGLLGGCFAFEGQPHGTKDLTATPAQLEGAEIVPKLGAKVPLDLMFLDEDGKPTTLGEVIPANKPTLLILGYWECPMLCSFVLNATKDGLAGVEGLEPGVDFQIVAVGIDPSEAQVGSAKLAKAKQQTYTRELARVRQAATSDPKEVPLSSWRFLSSPPVVGLATDKTESPQARALADALGFGYRWDPQTENYAHGAGIFFISPASRNAAGATEATLTRTLWGIQFKSSDLRLAIVESGQGLVGTVVDRVLLSCFQFGPEGQYSLYVWGVMRLGGIAMVLAMGAFLIGLFRREKRREAELEAAVLLGQSGAERLPADHQHKNV